MGELDEAWELALVEAERRARATGRRDIAEYLALRARNDLLRRTAIEWLLSIVTALAAQANRAGAAIQIEQRDAHRFCAGSATMVGTLLRLRSGVRALTIEAGWPRTPRDGFVRGGGLACANIKHLGRAQTNAELLLVRSPNGAPQWFVLEKTGTRVPLSEARLHDHFRLLLSET